MLGKRLFAVVFLMVGCGLLMTARAQFTDPRTYTNGPVGLNDLEFDYYYAYANASVDTSLVVGTEDLHLHKGNFSYTHNFDVFGHFAWANASIPFASLSGAVNESGISSSASGAGDASVEFAGLLMGGEALGAEELATHTPTTSFGVSLTVTLPTGEYNADALLNIGANRWSFKPEIGLSYPFGPEGKWVVDAYINVLVFTDNTGYRGAQVLRQEPLPGLEGHISYRFAPRFWASLDSRYAFHGETSINGVQQNNSQQSFVVGTEAHFSPNSQNSLTLVFAKALVHRNAPAYTGIVVKFVHSWGGANGGPAHR